MRLKAAREAAGLSVLDVAAATESSSLYIMAIEAGDFAALPSSPEINEIVKKYADVAGLDISALSMSFMKEKSSEGLKAKLRSLQNYINKYDILELMRLAEIVDEETSELSAYTDYFLGKVFARKSLSSNDLKVLRLERDSLVTFLPFFHSNEEHHKTFLFDAEYYRPLNGVRRSLFELYWSTVYILENYINKNAQSKLSSLGVEARVALLESYAKRHGGEGITDYHRLLFPELHDAASGIDKPGPPLVAHDPSTSMVSFVEASLPKTPPEQWELRSDKGEKPPYFVQRVYGDWLGKGLTRAHIRELDKPLWQALSNWLRKNEMPADVDLPTRTEQNTRWIQKIEQEGLLSIPGADAGFALREATRLSEIQRHRTRRLGRQQP